MLRECCTILATVKNLVWYKIIGWKWGRGQWIKIKYLSIVEALLNIPTEKADKLLRPLIKNEMFKITVGPANSTRWPVCNIPEKPADEMEKQAGSRTFKKIVNMLESIEVN
jgi:hypothetical protein